MGNKEHIIMVRQGTKIWNEWRQENSKLRQTSAT